jgi:hypothetical protein
MRYHGQTIEKVESKDLLKSESHLHIPVGQDRNGNNMRLQSRKQNLSPMKVMNQKDTNHILIIELKPSLIIGW